MSVSFPTLAEFFSPAQVSNIQFNSTLQIYKNDMIVHHPGLPGGMVEPPLESKKRGEIKTFSKASCRRAVFVAHNSTGLTSQFLCTYHDVPTDGIIIKKQLNKFLVYVRRTFPGVIYFWFLEFQQRGSPHFHVFLNIPTTKQNRLKLADLWLLASNQQYDIASIKFHQHKKNFFDWNLNGHYVAKYAAKEYQKEIPENFKNVGRFWGATRGIAPVVSNVEVTAQTARFLKKLFLTRLKAKKKIPYKIYRAYQKSRRFIVNVTDKELCRLLTKESVYGYRVFNPDLRGLPPCLLIT